MLWYYWEANRNKLKAYTIHHHATTEMPKNVSQCHALQFRPKCSLLRCHTSTSAISHPDQPYSLPTRFPSCPTVSFSFSPRYASRLGSLESYLSKVTLKVAQNYTVGLCCKRRWTSEVLTSFPIVYSPLSLFSLTFKALWNWSLDNFSNFFFISESCALDQMLLHIVHRISFMFSCFCISPHSI